MKRDAIPTSTRRAVLVEAGHRCAIPACRHPTTEIAHVVAWAQTQDHSFENLIALCPNCHTRYDKGEIDRQSMLAYKHNLGLLNHRYSELERRVFEIVAKTNERILVVGAGSDILLYNAVEDGLLEDLHIQGAGLDISGSDGFKRIFPLSFTYRVTDAGLDFIQRYAAGRDLS